MPKPAKRLTWADMVQQGVVQRLRVQPEQVGLDKAPEPSSRLWFGDLNHPDLGKSLLGDNGWNNLRLQLKGRRARLLHHPHGRQGIVQGLGLCARRHLRPGAGAPGCRFLHLPRPRFAQPLYRLDAAGAPSYNEVRHLHHPLGRVLWPPTLEAELPGQPRGPRHGTRSFASFDTPYWLPASMLQGGRPIEEPDAPWVRMWKTRAVEMRCSRWCSSPSQWCTPSRKAHPPVHPQNKWPVNGFQVHLLGPGHFSGSALAPWRSPPSRRC